MISLAITDRGQRPLAGLSTHLHIVAYDFGVSEAALRGPGRMRFLVLARREFCLRATVLGYSSTEIGRAINRDHTTVLHLLDRLGRTPAYLEAAE